MRPLGSAIPYIGEEVLRASQEGGNTRWGNRHPRMAPHGVYPVQGSDQWIALACRNDDDWQGIASVIEVDASRFGTFAARRASEDEIDAPIAGWSSLRPRSVAVAELAEAGVPVAPVLDVLEILDYPEFANRDGFPGSAIQTWASIATVDSRGALQMRTSRRSDHRPVWASTPRDSRRTRLDGVDHRQAVSRWRRGRRVSFLTRSTTSPETHPCTPR